MNIRQLRFQGDDFNRYKHILGESNHANETARIELLSNALKITKALTPKLFRIVGKVENKLKIDIQIEYYACNDTNINASCFTIGDNLIVILTSGLINIMDEHELSFVIGHEIGHYLFGHLQCGSDKSNAESIEYSQSKEISADRVGFICSKDINTSVKAIIKIISGLNDSFISNNFHTFLHQHNEISDKGLDLLNLSHPLLPTRAKSLMLFSMSELYYNWENSKKEAPISTQELENSVQNYLDKTSLKSIKERHVYTVSIFKMWVLAKIFVESNNLGIDEFAVLNNEIGKERTNKLKKYISSNNIEKINKKYQEYLAEFIKLPKKYQDKFLEDMANIFEKNVKNYNHQTTIKNIKRKIETFA